MVREVDVDAAAAEALVTFRRDGAHGVLHVGSYVAATDSSEVNAECIRRELADALRKARAEGRAGAFAEAADIARAVQSGAPTEIWSAATRAVANELRRRAGGGGG